MHPFPGKPYLGAGDAMTAMNRIHAIADAEPMSNWRKALLNR